MGTPAVVSMISAATGLVASALTYFLTKKKEREAEWRKQKLDHYKELLAGLNGIVAPSPSGEARDRFACAANNIFLVASPPVLVALRGFLDETADSNPKRSLAGQDRELTKLLFAIRDDLGIRPNAPDSEYTFHLWAGRCSSDARVERAQDLPVAR